MWRDPLDELIEDLEGVVPAQPAVPDQRRSILKDMNEVVMARCFYPRDELERWLANPRNLQLEKRVMDYLCELFGADDQGEVIQSNRTEPATVEGQHRGDRQPTPF